MSAHKTGPSKKGTLLANEWLFFSIIPFGTPSVQLIIGVIFMMIHFQLRGDGDPASYCDGKTYVNSRLELVTTVEMRAV